MDAYREMLTYIKSAVTRNYSEKCINNILDFVSNGANQNLELLQEFYQTTLKALEEAKNEVNIPWLSSTFPTCLHPVIAHNVLFDDYTVPDLSLQPKCCNPGIELIGVLSSY